MAGLFVVVAICLTFTLITTVSSISLQQCNGVGTILVRQNETANITCEISETTQNVTWTFLSLLETANRYVIVEDCALLSRHPRHGSCQSQVPFFQVVRPHFSVSAVEVIWNEIPNGELYGMIECSLDGKMPPERCYLMSEGPMQPGVSPTTESISTATSTSTIPTPEATTTSTLTSLTTTTTPIPTTTQTTTTPIPTTTQTTITPIPKTTTQTTTTPIPTTTTQTTTPIPTTTQTTTAPISTTTTQTTTPIPTTTQTTTTIPTTTQTTTTPIPTQTTPVPTTTQTTPTPIPTTTQTTTPLPTTTQTTTTSIPTTSQTTTTQTTTVLPSTPTTTLLTTVQSTTPIPTTPLPTSPTLTPITPLPTSTTPIPTTPTTTTPTTQTTTTPTTTATPIPTTQTTATPITATTQTTTPTPAPTTTTPSSTTPTPTPKPSTVATETSPSTTLTPTETPSTKSTNIETTISTVQISSTTSGSTATVSTQLPPEIIGTVSPPTTPDETDTTEGGEANRAGLNTDEEKLSTAALIACVVGVLTIVPAVAVGAVVFFHWRRRKRRTERLQKDEDEVAGFYNAAYINTDTLTTFRSFPSASWRHTQRNSKRFKSPHTPTTIMPATLIPTNDLATTAELNFKPTPVIAIPQNIPGNEYENTVERNTNHTDANEGGASDLDFDPYSRIYRNVPARGSTGRVNSSSANDDYDHFNALRSDVARSEVTNPEEVESWGDDDDLYTRVSRSGVNPARDDGSTNPRKEKSGSIRPMEDFYPSGSLGIRSNLSAQPSTSLRGLQYDRQRPFSHVGPLETSSELDAESQRASFLGYTVL